MKQLKKYLMICIILLLLMPSILAEVDEAKEIIENFYLYSQEKDVESYAALFDQEFLIAMYGKDYATYFKEGFALVDITSYKLKFTQFTESSEGATLMYTLNAKAIVDGEKITIENDLAALFSKSGGILKLKYIILQSTLITQMNQEAILTSAMLSQVDDAKDIVQEARDAGVSLVNIEDAINETKARDRNKWLLPIILVVIVGLGYWKREEVKKHAPKHIATLKKHYKKHAPIIKKNIKKYSAQGLKKTKKIVKKTSKTLKKEIKKLRK